MASIGNVADKNFITAVSLSKFFVFSVCSLSVSLTGSVGIAPPAGDVKVTEAPASMST